MQLPNTCARNIDGIHFSVHNKLIYMKFPRKIEYTVAINVTCMDIASIENSRNKRTNVNLIHYLLAKPSKNAIFYPHRLDSFRFCSKFRENSMIMLMMHSLFAHIHAWSRAMATTAAMADPLICIKFWSILAVTHTHTHIDSGYPIR